MSMSVPGLSVALAMAAVTAGCSQPAQPPASAAPAPPAISAGARVAWYDQCWGYFNDKKFDEFAGCYADDVSSQQLGYGNQPLSSGVAAVVATSRDFAAAFPDGRGEPVLTLVNGDRIASVHILHGTNSGALKGADGKETKATNKPLSVYFGHLVETTEGALKVKRELGIMDSATLVVQLGLSKMGNTRPLAALPPANAPVTVVATNDPGEQANLRVEQATFEAWNGRDNKAMASYLADDYVLHGYSDPKDTDKAGQLALNTEFWGAFSDAKLSWTLWSAGDYVVAEGRFSGTNDGAMPSMKLRKTGNKVDLPYLQIDRFEGGKVREEWLFLDGGSFGAQLMAKPAAGK